VRLARVAIQIASTLLPAALEAKTQPRLVQDDGSMLIEPSPDA
jgi:hypothetical protein